jgi:hypothetical protein
MDRVAARLQVIDIVLQFLHEEGLLATFDTLQLEANVLYEPQASVLIRF